MNALIKRLTLPVILCLLPMALGLFLYPQLPAQIPSHWGFDGTVNDYMSKVAMVFGMPLFMAAMTIFVAFMMEHDPKKRNQAGAIKTLSLWLCPVMSLLLVPMSLFIALGYDLPVATIICIFVGLLFVIIGNYLPKSKQNYTIGIRLPWTLNSEENWNRTHRLAGKIWVLMGLVMVLMALFAGQTVWFTALFTITILLISTTPALYSYCLYRNGI
ncbi:SdpI family protein [Bengtsoniella intestinalis]|uniref:SdpI family protein n=1 Tax=Bengtsoniella intestinalis TaxID=3073143 RepID=UPI00391F000C